MIEKLILSLLILVPTIGTSYAYTNYVDCVDYAAKSKTQYDTNLILSCDFQGSHWHEDFDKHLKWCTTTTPQIVERTFRKRTQLLFNCLGEQNSRLSKSEFEATTYELDNKLKKSITKHDKKRFVLLLAAGADLGIPPDINYYGDDFYFYSISQGAVEITKLLSDHGISPNRFYTSNKILLHSILDSTIYNLLDNHQLLALFFIRDLDANLLLPQEKLHASFLALALSEAVNDGDIKTTRALLKKGADPNFIDIKTDDDWLRNPLIRAIDLQNFASVNTSYEFVKLLLEFGAYPNLLANGKDLCNELLNRKVIVELGNPLSHAEVLASLSDLYEKDPEEAKKIVTLLKNSGAISLYGCMKEREQSIAEVAVKNNGMALKYTSDEIKKNKKIVLIAVKQNGMALEFADPSLQKDRDIVMAAVKNKGTALQFASESLKREKDIILQAVKNNGEVIFELESEQIDKDIVLAAVSNGDYIIDRIDKKYQNDNDIIIAAGLRNPNEIEYLKNQPSIHNKKDMLELLKKGASLKLASDKLRDDKELVLTAISISAKNIEYASKRLKNNKEIMLIVFKKDPDQIKYSTLQFKNATQQLRNNKQFILKLVSIDGDTLDYASKHLKKDRQVVLAAIKQYIYALRFADKSFKKDRETISLAVTKEGRTLQFADDSLKNDKQIVMAAIKQDGYALKYASKALRADRDMVLEAVKNNQNGYSLENTSKALRADREVVLEAVKNNPDVLNYTSKALKADRDIVLEAVKHYGSALQYAEEVMTKDKDIVLAAIKNDPDSIQYAHKSLFSNREFVLAALNAIKKPKIIINLPFASASPLKNDPDIVLQLVKINGLALQFANPTLQKDPQIVAAAIKQNILALKYAGEPIRQNRQWILDFIKKSGSLPRWINKKFLKDKALLLATVKIDGMALRYADNSLKKDREVVLTAVKQEAEAFQYADKDLLDNKSVVLDAIKLNGRAYYFASKRLQSDNDVMLAALKKKINVLRLLSDQTENKAWITSDAAYSIQRIDLESPLVLNNLDKLRSEHFIFSPDGLLFAAATELSTGRAQIKIWSTKNGKLLYSTIVKYLPVISYQGLIFSPDSKRLINLDEDEDRGFIWNFQQGEDPLPCGTGIDLREISSQTHSMLTNPADAPLGLFSLNNCDNLGYSPEFITVSPYVISPDNKMIIRDNTFINNEKYEQILAEWDDKKHQLVFIHQNYIQQKEYWRKSFSDSAEPLGDLSYYPDYKTRKLFYLDKKYIWIVNIDTGELIKKFPIPDNSIITKLPTVGFSYWSGQAFVISNDNKIMVIDGGREKEGIVEMISLETGKILHSMDFYSDTIEVPPRVPVGVDGVYDYCSSNSWECLFDFKTGISPNGQFIQYGRRDSSSVLIDSLNDKQILKLPALIRSDISESKTGETMFVSMQRANVMSLWKIKRNNLEAK